MSSKQEETAASNSMAEALQRLGLDAVYLPSYTQLHEALLSSASDPCVQLEARDLAKDTIRNLLGSRKKLGDMLIQAIPTLAHHISVGNEGHIYFNEALAAVVGVTNTQQATALVRQASQSSTLPPQQATILQELLLPSSPKPKIQPRTSQQVYASHKKAVGIVKAFKEQMSVIAAGLPPAPPEEIAEPQPATVEPVPAAPESAPPPPSDEAKESHKK